MPSNEPVEVSSSPLIEYAVAGVSRRIKLVFEKSLMIQGANKICGFMVLWAFALGQTVLITSTPPVQARSAKKFPHPDRLSAAPWWIDRIKAQAQVKSNQIYQGCLFGDSISAGLGHSLGREIANFGQGGLSSASLLTQLKIVRAANIQCQQVVMAVGTNDAWYSIKDDAFVSNMRTAIALTRTLGSDRIVVIPAFYSTLAASKKPGIAGTLARVDQINLLLRHVAAVERVGMVTKGLESLFQNHSLKRAFTADGVHLNNPGKALYRQVLTQLFSRPQDVQNGVNPRLGNGFESSVP
jgi:lysophospholipase L1-like esterase